MEESDSDLTTHCSNPMEGGSNSITHNLELLKQALFTDANKNWDVSDYCEE